MSHANTGAVPSLHAFDDSLSGEAARAWLSRALNREPDPIDLYGAGKELYQSGRFLAAATMLQLYCTGAGSESVGHHLLGYSYFHLGEKRKAANEIKRVVNSGFDADWQLLIELQVDLDREAGLLPAPAERMQPPA